MHKRVAPLEIWLLLVFGRHSFFALKGEEEELSVSPLKKRLARLARKEFKNSFCQVSLSLQALREVNKLDLFPSSYYSVYIRLRSEISPFFSCASEDRGRKKWSFWTLASIMHAKMFFASLSLSFNMQDTQKILFAMGVNRFFLTKCSERLKKSLREHFSLKYFSLSLSSWFPFPTNVKQIKY